MTKFIANDRRGRRRFKITWEEKYENIEVRMGDRLLGHINSLEEFEGGKQFSMTNGDYVVVKLKERANILVDDHVLIEVDEKRIKAKRKKGTLNFLLELIAWW
jgi:hypothetical protein